MAVYVYIDSQGHQLTMTQPIDADDELVCDACGEVMWRKPQMVAVTWAGGKPSENERQDTQTA